MASPRYDDATKEAARALGLRGYKPAQIKRELRLDCSLSTIMRWLGAKWEPTEEQRQARNAYGKEWRQRNRRTHNRKRIARQRQAFAALKRVEQERRVAKAGGSISKAYALVRKAAQELDRALFEVETPVRPAVRAALAAAHETEDAIVRASRTPTQQKVAA
jgi:hypothetical protein